MCHRPCHTSGFGSGLWPQGLQQNLGAAALLQCGPSSYSEPEFEPGTTVGATCSSPSGNRGLSATEWGNRESNKGTWTQPSIRQCCFRSHFPRGSGATEPLRGAVVPMPTPLPQVADCRRQTHNAYTAQTGDIMNFLHQKQQPLCIQLHTTHNKTVKAQNAHVHYEIPRHTSLVDVGHSMVSEMEMATVGAMSMAGGGVLARWHLFLTISHPCRFLPPPHQTIWSTFSPCLRIWPILCSQFMTMARVVVGSGGSDILCC